MIARRTSTPTSISRRHIRINRTHRVPITPSFTHAPVTQILALPRMLAPGVTRVACPLGDFPLNEGVHAHGPGGVGTMACALSAGGVGGAAAREAGVVVVSACGCLAGGTGFASAPAAEAEAGSVDSAVAGGGCGGHVAVG